MSSNFQSHLHRAWAAAYWRLLYKTISYQVKSAAVKAARAFNIGNRFVSIARRAAQISFFSLSLSLDMHVYTHSFRLNIFNRLYPIHM